MRPGQETPDEDVTGQPLGDGYRASMRPGQETPDEDSPLGLVNSHNVTLQ